MKHGRIVVRDMSDFVDYMAVAIEEAELSLREGDCGFGAVVARNEEIIARAHDTERTAQDPTAHAELTAIRQAAARLGRSLNGCQLIATHEPCPMCSTAILWAGIDTVAFGYSIAEAIRQGRNRIDLSCKEVFERARKPVSIHDGVLHARCAILYNREVRDQIDALRAADETTLRKMADTLTRKRLAWFNSQRHTMPSQDCDPLDAAYRLLLRKLGITPDESPILERGPKRLVLASRNFCPTLEACRILGLNTRFVCKHLTERPTNELLRQVHPGLRFTRNYETLRPFGEYCEETIYLDD